MLISETEFRYQVEQDIKPFRDVLLGLFFVTVGMMLDPAALIDYWYWIFGLLVLILVAKTVIVAGLGRLFGTDASVSLRSALALAGAGEFGLVLLAQAANLAVVTALTTAFLLPVVYADGESLHVPNQRTWLLLVAYGVICQGLAWAIISRALRMVEASRAGLLLLLQPTLTFVWDVLFFARPTTTLEACGAIVALAAIYLGSARRS